MRVPIGVSGGGVWGRVQGGGGGGRFSGGGAGEGTGKGTGKSMRARLSKLPFSNLPFSFFPIITGHFTAERSSEVNKRGRPSKWPPECPPSKFAGFECAFSL